MRIVNWCIDAELENGERVRLFILDDDISQLVDEYLSEQEAN